MENPAPGQTTPEVSPQSFLARGAAQLALFLSALLLTLGLAARVAAPGGGDLLGAKLQAYGADAHTLDTVFLGSSHVHRAFVPEVFDAALAAQGQASRSFNLGVQSTHQLELEHLARVVLAAGAGSLRRLLVEYQTFTPELDPANAFHARCVYWHDARSTGLALERTAAAGAVRMLADEGEHSILGLAEECLPDWWELDRIHLQHFAKRGLMVARGDDFVKGLLGRPHGQTSEWRRTRGYLSLEEDERRAGARAESNVYRRRREAFHADLAGYEAELAALAAEPVFFGDGEWIDARLEQRHDLEAYRRIAAAARAAGVELVLVVMPQNACDRAAEERLEQELGVKVLRYNLPREFPEFYAPALRFDSGHASEEGARVFTRLLARQLVRSTEAGP